MTRLSTTALFLVAACGGAPAPETKSPPAAATPSSAPVASAQQTPLPAANATPATARPASPFHVIGTLPGEVLLYGVGARGFLASHVGIVYALEGDEIIHDPLLQRGFSKEPMTSFAAIGGDWPSAAWMTTTHPAGRTGFTKLWRWEGKHWVPRQSTTEGRFIDFVKPWVGGRQLAVEQAGMMFDAKLVVLSGDKNVPVPTIERKNDPNFTCFTNIRIEAFDTLPSGEVVAAGESCTNDTDYSLAVERWAPGSKRGVLEPLPGAEQGETKGIRLRGLALRSATDISVAGTVSTWQKGGGKSSERSYLVHFDGTRWQEVPWKNPSLVESLAKGGDGSLVLLTRDGELYVGSSFATLALVPMPAELTADPELVPAVTSVWMPASGDIWAVTEMIAPKVQNTSQHTHKFQLLHTRPKTKPLPTVEQFEAKERAYRLPGPPVEWCETPFVLLYTLGKKAPADYDYPSTRAALKGHKEFAVEGVEFLEFERMDRRYFGARVPDFTLGKKLATLVKDKVPGATPELVCHDPPPKRTLTLDLAPPPTPPAAKK